MKYFLIIGLMMISSFAQANVCISLWWGPVTDVQIEIEADFNPLAMNERCEDGRWPVEKALENATYFPVFAAIMDNFELDIRTRYQLRTVAGRQLQQAYEELASRAESVFDNEPAMSALEFAEAYRNMSPEVQRVIIYFLSVSDEYPEIGRERVNNYIDDNQIHKGELISLETTNGRNYYASLFQTRDARRAGEAYDKALKEYRIRLAIYETVVPSE